MNSSIKLTDAQLLILSAASRREDRCLTAPKSLKRPAAEKLAAKLLAARLVREIKAKPNMPVWRRDEDAGRAFALNLTAAGLKAVATRKTTRNPRKASTPRPARKRRTSWARRTRRHRGLARQQGSPRRPATRRLQTPNRRLCRRRPAGDQDRSRDRTAAARPRRDARGADRRHR